MKKRYIKPHVETWFMELQNVMRLSGHDNNMPEGKEQDIIEDDDDSYKKTDVSYEDMSIKKLWDDENA